MNRKTTRFIAAFLLFGVFNIFLLNLNAQVTIGLNEEPASGALLQLKSIAAAPTDKQNSTKGLLLPRVNLVGVTDPKIGPSTDFTTQKDIHTGLVVYNLFDNTATVSTVDKQLCPGPYVWNGVRWDRLFGPCTAFYTGKINCDNNISDITIGVCQTLNKLGSFQLTAYGDAVITIKDQDVLGKIGNYEIIAQKAKSYDGDPQTYIVTKDNSPLDINVIVKGPSSDVATSVTIPIDLSSYITGGITTNIEGCPYSVVNVTTNYLLVDPSTIIFTSGKDGLSRGYQAVQDAGSFFAAKPLNSSTDYDYVDNVNHLVRPWGISGITFTERGASISNPPVTGTVKTDLNYWPFNVRFQPETADIAISTSPTVDYDKDPAFELVHTTLPKTNLYDGGCGYKMYKTTDVQELLSGKLVWGNFIHMEPIDQAPAFTAGGRTFRINEPYALRKEVTLEQNPGGAIARFDVRQIHYGTQILDLNGDHIRIDGSSVVVENYDFAANNNEFKFKIRSNAKWQCTYLFGSIPGVANDLLDYSGSNLQPNDYGPEEDAYGDPRERIVTIKMSQVPTEDGKSFQISIHLRNPKLVNESFLGRENLTIHLFKGNKP